MIFFVKIGSPCVIFCVPGILRPGHGLPYQERRKRLSSVNFHYCRKFITFAFTNPGKDGNASVPGFVLTRTHRIRLRMKPKTRIVLLTGGSSGIGKAAAKILSDDGMIVYSASRSASGDATDGRNGGKIIPVAMDVNDETAIDAVIKRIISEQGRIDALVSNAGNGIGGAIEETTAEEARYQFETTFFGSMNMVRACLPVMRKEGYGKIILIGSVASFIPIPFQAYYSAAKSALLTITRALSLELKGTGVSCGCILPGDIKTGFTANRKMTAQSENPESHYYGTVHRSIAKMEHDEQHGMPPEAIGIAIRNQLRKKGKVRLSVIPGFIYKLIGAAWKLLPERLVMWVVGLLYL